MVSHLLFDVDYIIKYLKGQNSKGYMFLNGCFQTDRG